MTEHRCLGAAGIEPVDIAKGSGGARGRVPADGCRWLARDERRLASLNVSRGEQVQPVADDGAADRRAVLEKIEFAGVGARGVLTDERLILHRRKDTCLPSVGARSRYPIDEPR